MTRRPALVVAEAVALSALTTASLQWQQRHSRACQASTPAPCRPCTCPTAPAHFGRGAQRTVPPATACSSLVPAVRGWPARRARCRRPRPLSGRGRRRRPSRPPLRPGMSVARHLWAVVAAAGPPQPPPAGHLHPRAAPPPPAGGLPRHCGCRPASAHRQPQPLRWHGPQAAGRASPLGGGRPRPPRPRRQARHPPQRRRHGRPRRQPRRPAPRYQTWGGYPCWWVTPGLPTAATSMAHLPPPRSRGTDS